MRYRRHFLTAMLGLASLLGLTVGCSNYDLDSEATTAFFETFDVEEDTEDTSITYTSDDNSEVYTTDVTITDWNGYEITTNDIDYDPSEAWLDEDGYYTSEVDVATYIIEYQTLPENFITKKEAKSLGWTGGSLDDYLEDGCIGGDYFGNYEGLLPQVKGRKYYECDIDTMGAKKRGAKRIIYSNDGQIYYTDDHYESFTLIYGSDQQ